MQKLKRWLGYLLGHLPIELPTGSQAFDLFASKILKTYGLPDERSYRNAIATMILHMGPQRNYAPPRFFAKAIFKSMANQIAYQKMQDFKEEKTELEVVGGSAAERPSENLVSQA